MSDVLIKIEEFLNTANKMYKVESLGGFYGFMKRQGMPPKLSFARWKEKLEEFLKRKV